MAKFLQIKLVDLPSKEKFILKPQLIQAELHLVLFFVFKLLFDSFNLNLSLILSIGFLISIVG